MKAICRVAGILIALAMPCLLPAENAGAPPLPSMDEVLRRVLVQAEKEKHGERAFNQLYSYTRTRVTEYRNGKGEVKKREAKQSEQKPAIPPVQPASRGMPEGRSGAETNANASARGRPYERKDFSINEDLLGRFEFTLAGREIVNGRPTLVITFQPAGRKLAERDLKDRFINRTAGRVWVDEADYLLVRAHFHLTETVNVLGGLVGAVHRFTCELNRERTDEGLWFTRALNWRLDGRKLLVHQTIEYAEERTNLRKTRPAGGEPVAAGAASE